MFRSQPAALAIHATAAARQYIFCVSRSRLVSARNDRSIIACGTLFWRLTLNWLSFCFDVTLAFSP
jgi:hypothetical protein